MALGSNAMNMIFDGANLKNKYNLMVANISNDNVEYYKNHQSMDVKTDKTSNDDTFHIINKGFSSEQLEYTFQLFHACGKEDEPFTRNEIEEINRLFVRDTNDYYKLQLIDEDFGNCYCWCTGTIVEKIFVGGYVRGLQVTVKLANPYWYDFDVHSVTCNVTDGANMILNDTSGLPNHEIYPDVEIRFLTNGDFNMTNSMTGCNFGLKNCVAGEVVTIKGNIHAMSSNIRTTSALFNGFTYDFPSIANRYDSRKNVFTFSGCNAIVTMKYRANRLVGA